MDELDWTGAAALIALMHLPRVGPAKALAVARGERRASELAGDHALEPLLAEALRELAVGDAAGVQVMGFFDPAFPARLRAIPAAPAVGYVRGDASALDR